MATLSWVYIFGTRENIFGLMMTRLGRVASKAFGPVAQEIPWIGFDRIRGSKPRIAWTTGVPFLVNPGDDSMTASNAKTRGVKTSMAGMACPFFGSGASESTSDFVISSIMTEVEGARGILHKRSYKYSSQSFLDPINIALWLVPAWVLGGHRLAAMESLLCIDSFSIYMIPRFARLWTCARSTL